jgi:hypothetical protein
VASDISDFGIRQNLDTKNEACSQYFMPLPSSAKIELSQDTATGASVCIGTQCVPGTYGASGEEAVFIWQVCGLV